MTDLQIRAEPALRRMLAARPAAGAVVLMVAASGFMSGQHAVVRHLAPEIHTFEIVFFRNLFGFLWFLPWLLRSGPAALATRRFGTHAMRALLNTASLMAYFAALGMIPLADATALNLTIPLFVAVGAILFLGERVSAARWTALAVGAAGALAIVRPGFEAVTPGVLLVMGASVCAAGTRLMAKSLSGTDKPSAIVAWVAVLMTPVTLIPALFVWHWPALWEWPLLVAVGGLGAIGQLCFVKAYALADITFAEPMAFTRLLWAAAIGYLWFGEFPDFWTWAGGALIVAGTTILARGRTRPPAP